MSIDDNRNEFPAQRTAIAMTNTCTHKQRDAILKMLAHSSLNTLEFRSAGIDSPAPRILKLREAGWNIKSTREIASDSAVVKHRGIARYWLIIGGGND